MAILCECAAMLPEVAPTRISLKSDHIIIIKAETIVLSVWFMFLVNCFIYELRQRCIVRQGSFVRASPGSFELRSGVASNNWTWFAHSFSHTAPLPKRARKRECYASFQFQLGTKSLGICSTFREREREERSPHSFPPKLKLSNWAMRDGGTKVKEVLCRFASERVHYKRNTHTLLNLFAHLK